MVADGDSVSEKCRSPKCTSGSFNDLGTRYYAQCPLSDDVNFCAGASADQVEGPGLQLKIQRYPQVFEIKKKVNSTVAASPCSYSVVVPGFLYEKAVITFRLLEARVDGEEWNEREGGEEGQKMPMPFSLYLLSPEGSTIKEQNGLQVHEEY